MNAEARRPGRRLSIPAMRCELAQLHVDLSILRYRALLEKGSRWADRIPNTDPPQHEPEPANKSVGVQPTVS